MSDDGNFRALEDIRGLDEIVSISTITAQCNLQSTFNTLNIFKYIDLEKGKIESAKYANCLRTPTESLMNSTISAKKSKQIKTFYNQVTLEINKNKIKLFDNGSIHITGCKGYENIKGVISILCDKLNVKKGILTEDNGVVEIDYIEPDKKISLNDISDFTINLINCGFKFGFSIEILKLYDLLISGGIECVCDLDLHACVNIKFKCCMEDKIVSIFVFRKDGNVIITGGTCRNHIEQAYNFIYKKIRFHYNEIIDVSSEMENI